MLVQDVMEALVVVRFWGAQSVLEEWEGADVENAERFAEQIVAS